MPPTDHPPAFLPASLLVGDSPGPQGAPRRFVFASVSTADADALAALRVRAMRESLERIGRFDPERARQRFLGAFQPGHTRQVLEDGRRIGFFVLRPGGGGGDSDTGDGGNGEGGWLLDHLYIAPEAQGLGAGAAVLRAVFAEADARGADVRVTALRGSDANRFYLRHGFVHESDSEWDHHYVRHARRARPRAPT